MVEVELVGVRGELPHNQPIVLLKERVGERYLPIWIGSVEATSIARAMQGVATPRPMTHDLMRDLLDALGTSVERVVVTELRDGTFYADVVLGSEAREVVVSARPSDALALAVRTACPVYAEETVLDEVGIEIEDEEEDEVERFKEFLDEVTPDDFR